MATLRYLRLSRSCCASAARPRSVTWTQSDTDSSLRDWERKKLKKIEFMCQKKCSSIEDSEYLKYYVEKTFVQFAIKFKFAKKNSFAKALT